MKRPAADHSTTTSAHDALMTIADRLRCASAVATITHSKPDGDAIGSSLALTRTLERLSKRAVAVYPPPWRSRFDRIVGETPIVPMPPGEHDVVTPFEPEEIVVVDTRAWSQVAEAGRWLRNNHEHVLVIDHHKHGDEDMGAVAAIDPSAAAACQIVAKLCVELLGVKDAAALPLDIAEPLYLGLATDTGWFRHPSVSASVMALAASLLRAGANHAKLLYETEQVERPQRLAMMRAALDSLEMHEQDRVAIMSLRRADYARAGAESEDAGGFVDIPLCVQSVLVTAVLTEASDTTTKISLRSKRPGVVDGLVTDVNRVAMTFGGGGHVQASGALAHESLDRAKALLLEAIRGVQ